MYQFRQSRPLIKETARFQTVIDKHFPRKKREKTSHAQDHFPNDEASLFWSPGQTNSQVVASSRKLDSSRDLPLSESCTTSVF